MSYALLYFNQQYFYQLYDNSFKTTSLEDNVYFTLKDLMLNIDENLLRGLGVFQIKLIQTKDDDVVQQNTLPCIYYNRPQICYTNVLNNKHFVEQLLNMFNLISSDNFEFEVPDCIEEVHINNYILFHHWWRQFTTLKSTLTQQLEMLNNY
jgi:hypothetical protein